MRKKFLRMRERRFKLTQINRRTARRYGDAKERVLNVTSTFKGLPIMMPVSPLHIRALSCLALALMMTASTGCATNSALAKLRTEVHDAQRTADQALSTAQEANARSQRTEEMVNRSYRHSMRK
jgi:hypothetical protein